MMNNKTNYQTEQEKFWAGEFGTDYIDRNKGEKLLASNLNFIFSKFNEIFLLFSIILLEIN